MGDSNFTERNSRRSTNGVLGVDCTSDGSDLNWPPSLWNTRLAGCGVPLGDQIPIGSNRKVEDRKKNISINSQTNTVVYENEHAFDNYTGD